LGEDFSAAIGGGLKDELEDDEELIEFESGDGDSHVEEEDDVDWLLSVGMFELLN
jgi:hypothetical protein